MNSERWNVFVRPGRGCSLVAATAFSLLSFAAGGAEATVSFNRDIRPILTENCFACHGPDANKRKASLRLDTKEGLFERTPKREPAVVPGKLEKSELWARVTTDDTDDKMPPPDSPKQLSPEQVQKLKEWIVAGAPWQGHWAFVKPERPPVPAKFKTAGAKFKVRNPIDAFVLAGIENRGLTPNPEADKRALARRVSLDLTGLPPTPAELQAFLNDRSPDSYEKLVRKLLALPRYGEHRARYWLDAARYADTHGLHFDNYREIWPYRDWVIRAFNRNQPFDEFTIEQLAGDLLEDPTEDQRTATGFQRCNLTTNEGGTIEEENLANYANDRVTTLGWVYLGLTMNCAACHDHKFDPITTREFYSMAAFFRNTKQSGFDKNIRESDLFMIVPQTDSDRARWKALPGELDAARQARDEQARSAEGEFTNWLAAVDAGSLAKSVALEGDYLRVALNEGAGSNVTAQLGAAERSIGGPAELEWQTNAPLGAAPVLRKDRTFVVGAAGDFESREPFSFGAWVFLPKDFKGEGAVIAKMGGEPEKYRGWELFVRDEDFGMKLVHRWSSVAMEVRSTDKPVKRGEWQHLFVTYDGSERTRGVKLFVNGIEAKANRDNNRLEYSIRNEFPLRIGRRERNSELKNVAVQDVRILRRRLSQAEVRAVAVAPRAAEWIAAANGEPTNAAVRAALRDYFHVTRHQGWQRAQTHLAALEREQQAIRGRSPVTLVQEEKKDAAPMAAILFRGEYDKPREKVGAATPAVLHAMPPTPQTNRLTLARWIVSPENPLTARVTVNRFWQEIFGTGLVKTTDDFGVMGEAPSHPDLLDWLAVEFRESGWDVKRLLELIVTSSTYRQSADLTPEKLERDPQNRLLSRGPRFRMDGEMIRDHALAVSGLLVDKIGGPSVKPFQPEGIWEAVAMPESNTRHYLPDEGDGRYRRSLYTFWKRAAPPALMDIFNAPSREVCTVRRERTNTPLQALATLNGPEFIEAARQLAEAALVRARGKDEEAVEFMAERLLARVLTSKERAIVKNTLAEMQAFYTGEPQAANELLAVGHRTRSSNVPAPQLAALTMVANQLMNLDEVLNK